MMSGGLIFDGFKRMYKLLRLIPIFGTILFIANSYAYQGDVRAEHEFATPSLWLRAIMLPLVLALGLAAVTLWPLTERLLTSRQLCIAGLSDFLSKPGALIIATIPNLLGFGIGVYALIFALAAPFVRQVHEAIERKKTSGSKKNGSVLMINADLAYPLVILLISVVVGVLQQAFVSSPALLIGAWLAMWYSLMVTLEVISVLFRLGEHSLLDKTISNAPAVDEKREASDSAGRS